IKPLSGAGGRGAQRWDRISERLWSCGNQTLDDEALIAHLLSKRQPLIVQKLVRPHSALAPLTSGALPTTRLLTCLDENGVPEIMAAVFRMSIGPNRTVDN